ncbi:FMN-dependent dehydrogenase [Biscogniauxia mediterranea]|nr:FMN-dependent dehydrogenase [Biscogniauxia mediterranea]
MRRTLISLSLLGGVLAARPFLDEPDTGFDSFFSNLTTGQLAPLDQLVGLPDFEDAAKRYLPIENYTYYRNGAAGEWSFRNNLEVFYRYPLRPRTMVDTSNVQSTLPTTILGYNFSAPFFIPPAARAGLGNPEAERGLIEGAAAENILYIPSLYATLSIPEIASYKAPGQITFQQAYLDPSNDTATQLVFDQAKAAGSKAIVFTVDAPAESNRQRANRYDASQAVLASTAITWDYYSHLKTLTDLPIILKGIQTVEEARAAVAHGAPAVYLSNHGGRQVDGSRSPLEVAIEIRAQAPEVFTQTEVYADGGVRYGGDVVKLLALGVRAVGVGRPFMYANMYGAEGVARAAQMLKREIALDAANAGVADLKSIDPSYVVWKQSCVLD